jgi:3-hydroxy-9,10-secoandrosta-1,3,5(10)-triene-9,17-dione monooxygenase reductase component
MIVGALLDPAELLHVDSVEESTFRDAMSLFATGVAVITSRSDGSPVGMTASAVTSLSLHPVLLLVCVNSRLPTHRVLESTGRFAVNVLGETDSVLARRFATPGIDKFSGVRHADRGGVPVLHDSIAYFVCDVHERLPGGDHSIFIGAVKQLGLRPGARPLLYFGARFGHLAGSQDALLRAWLEGAASG